MSRNNLHKASAFYLFASFFNKGIAFLTIPIFTRLLSTSDYGIVTTYYSWVDIMTVVLSLTLYMSIRIAFIDYKDKTDEYLNTIITFTILYTIVISIIILGVAKIANVDNFLLISCAIFHGASCAILMDYTQYLMMDFKYVKRSVYMSLPNFLSVICSIFVIVFIPMTNKYLGRILPTMIIFISFGVLILINTYSVKKPKINKKFLCYGLRISLPLVFHGIALSILSLSDRILITILQDASQTGIYSLVYNFGMLALVLTTALDGVWLPWFMKTMKEGDTASINSRAYNYIKLMTFAMASLMLVGPEILKLLASPAYWEGVSIIPPIVLANYFIFTYTFYVNVEHFYKKTLNITVNTIIAALINIGLNLIFIPIYGYVAAAYTTLISYIIVMSLHARFSHRLAKGVFPIKIFFIPFIVILFSMVCYYFYIDQWIIRWVITFLIFIIIIVIENKTIISYIRIRRK